MKLSSFLILSWLAALPLGCGQNQAEVDITERRSSSSVPTNARLNMGSAERFGQSPMGPATTNKPAAGAKRFDFGLPDGWSDVGARSMRALNFKVGSGTECYLVVLGGNGGGLIANLNRWQGQMGLKPLDAAAVDALPRITMFGASAHLLLAEGNFTDMDGNAAGQQAMLAAALERTNDAMFLKMVGPLEEVQANKAAFIELAQSLKEAK